MDQALIPISTIQKFSAPVRYRIFPATFVALGFPWLLSVVNKLELKMFNLDSLNMQIYFIYAKLLQNKENFFNKNIEIHLHD